MPATAKNIRESCRVQQDEAAAVERVSIAQQPCLAGKARERRRAHDKQQTGDQHAGLGQRDPNPRRRRGQQIGHGAAVDHPRHELRRELNADDGENEHEDEAVIFAGDERFGAVESVQAKGFAHALRHRRDDVVEGCCIFGDAGVQPEHEKNVEGGAERIVQESPQIHPHHLFVQRAVHASVPFRS
ncbi:hypothetical protein [Cohnella rhizosphaerae]|uniref:Uncharacterized protein n=1 Tax=Cohnella rhizosphaerae TaxID=1457232 RepID=A0A9X4KW84_9BACL|nr:hypothetical protein [Cohnella rhizosphaerae]MDG0811456.1 hypothetical protein [Cohnella rhizosphaerae]